MIKFARFPALLAALAGLLLAACATAPVAPALPAASGFPVKLPARGGGEAALRPPEGQLLLVDFFASWCVPCREAMPHHRGLALAHAGKLAVVAVSVDEDPAALSRFLEHVGPLPFPIGLDPAGAVASAFRVGALPTAVLVAADGTERWRGEAYDSGQLDAAIAAGLQALAAPAVPATD